MEDIANADLLVEIGYWNSACKLNNATNKHLALSNIFRYSQYQHFHNNSLILLFIVM